jgi:hypothetical protein
LNKSKCVLIARQKILNPAELIFFPVLMEKFACPKLYMELRMDRQLIQSGSSEWSTFWLFWLQDLDYEVYVKCRYFLLPR